MTTSTTTAPQSKRKLIDYTKRRHSDTTLAVQKSQTIAESVSRFRVPSFMYLKEKPKYTSDTILETDDDESAAVDFFLKAVPPRRMSRSYNMGTQSLNDLPVGKGDGSPSSILSGILNDNDPKKSNATAA